MVRMFNRCFKLTQNSLCWTIEARNNDVPTVLNEVVCHSHWAMCLPSALRTKREMMSMNKSSSVLHTIAILSKEQLRHNYSEDVNFIKTSMPFLMKTMTTYAIENIRKKNQIRITKNQTVLHHRTLSTVVLAPMWNNTQICAVKQIHWEFPSCMCDNLGLFSSADMSYGPPGKVLVL